MTKTQKALVAKWKRALRAGKYAQAYGVLRASDGHNDRYCCLGVLCVLSGQPSVDWDMSPDPFADMSGMPAEACKTLIHANDIDRMPFPQIADLITKLEREA